VEKRISRRKVKDRFLSKLRIRTASINPWVIAVTVTLATFMEVLDTSIANVACRTFPAACRPARTSPHGS